MILFFIYIETGSVSAISDRRRRWEACLEGPARFDIARHLDHETGQQSSGKRECAGIRKRQCQCAIEVEEQVKQYESEVMMTKLEQEQLKQLKQRGRLGWRCEQCAVGTVLVSVEATS